jgi:hypothetical protein
MFKNLTYLFKCQTSSNCSVGAYICICSSGCLSGTAEHIELCVTLIATFPQVGEFFILDQEHDLRFNNQYMDLTAFVIAKT